jgi:hypothetical protein
MQSDFRTNYSDAEVYGVLTKNCPSEYIAHETAGWAIQYGFSSGHTMFAVVADALTGAYILPGTNGDLKKQ